MELKTVKKRLKSVIGKSIPLKALIVTVLAVSVSSLIYCVLGDKLSYIGIDNTNLSYLQEYYKSINSASLNGSTHGDYTADNIYILDIDENITRDSLASIIEDVMDYEPKVVGIDILFRKNNDKGDTIFKNTIYKHANSIVIAQIIEYDRKEKKIKPNLFDDDVKSLNIGIANSYDFEKYNPESDCDTVGGEKYIHFAYKISKMFNPNLNINFDRFIINYSTYNFFNTDVWNFYHDSKDSTALRIKGKIVLIGNSESLFDIHPMPFIINGDSYLSGIYRHAYAINSLISNDVAMTRISIETGWNILIYLVMSFFYSILYVLLTDKTNIIVNKHKTTVKIIRPVLLLIVVPLLLLICYLLTTYFRIIPNVVLFLITVFIINTFNDFLELNINSSRYE